MWLILMNGLQSLKALFAERTPQEDYLAGREYALRTLLDSTDEPTLRSLWNQSRTDSTFGGNGRFDRGIADVLHEQGHADPGP